MLVGPNVQHTEFDEKGTEVLYIGLEILGEDGYAEGIYSEADYGIKEYMRKIYHEVTNRTVYSEQLINSYCTIIAIKLISAARKRPLISADRNLDNILNYIDSNFCCEIDTAKLAEMSGVQLRSFQKNFREEIQRGSERIYSAKADRTCRQIASRRQREGISDQRNRGALRLFLRGAILHEIQRSDGRYAQRGSDEISRRIERSEKG